MLNIIFDMDGTLIDSEECICKAVNAIRKDRGLVPLTHSFIKESTHTPGLNCAQIFYELDSIAPSYKVGFEAYFEAAYKEAKLFEGVDCVLQKCKAQNCYLAIASNAPEESLEPILARLNILGYFSAVLGSKIGRESKPSPMMIELILQNAPFERSIFVGNGNKDRGATQRAKIPYLHAKWGAESKSLKENEFNTALELWGLINRFLH